MGSTKDVGTTPAAHDRRCHDWRFVGVFRVITWKDILFISLGIIIVASFVSSCELLVRPMRNVYDLVGFELPRYLSK